MTKYSKALREKSALKFKNHCHQAIIGGYKAMLKSEMSYKEWEEEDISAVLYEEMKKLPTVNAKNITISTEARLYDKAILTGQKKAKKADRIDFKFSKWFFSNERVYYGEAKNISLKTWKKSNNAEVNASQYRGRYIETGIERLIFGKYAALYGFLIAYVVNGPAKENITALNGLIQSRELPPKIGLIEHQKSIANYKECYSSKNSKAKQEVFLQHIFLEFDM